MNVEDLSKSQLILLMILVNFVVSMATAIITVSFLSEAPPTVTQTVNQIVDHTIQTVTQVPGVTRDTGEPSPEQQLTNAIAAASARTVSIHGDATTTPVIAVGIYLPKSRAVATIPSQSLPKEAVIQFADGTAASASLGRVTETVAIYGFSDDAKLYNAPAASPIAFKDLKPGQTVISIVADSQAATGIISKVAETGIYTSLVATTPGAAAVNTAGNVIGIAGGATGVFITADQITAALTPAATP